MDKLKEYLSKKNQMGLVICGVVTVGLIAGVSMLSFQKTYAEPSKNLKEEFATAAKHADLKDYFTRQMNGKIAKQEEALRAAQSAIHDLDSHKAKEQIAELKALTEKMQSEIKLLKANQSMQRKSGSSEPRPVDTTSLPALPPAKDMGHVMRGQGLPKQGYVPSSPQGLATLSDELEITSVELEDSLEEEEFVFKEVETYVPAGTHVRGILIGGIDAHTEVYGRDETRVVAIRLTENGVIPNFHKAKLKNCVILASAWGNSSSERVAMRAERLTCTNTAGKVLETKVLGITYGPDGRQDVRGRVVYPEGKLIQRAFMAGTLSGMGNGVANKYTTNSISALGATTSVDGSDIFKFGAANGVSKGMDKLADYYIKRAEQLQPVIQVGAGVEVDVVFQKGFFLDGRDHDRFEEATEKPAGLYQARFEQPERLWEENARIQAQSVLNKISGGA